MKLVELNPKWINYGGRTGVGISFRDPSGRGGIRILFSNPLDGAPTLPDIPDTPSNNGGVRWERQGTDFETLTITPSIDGSPELSHFCVTNGEVT